MSLDTGVSQRHISFEESGRSVPSRELLLILAKTMEKRVVLLNHAGEIIGGDEVTANGKHVVTKPTGKVADVYVNWVKIND